MLVVEISHSVFGRLADDGFRGIWGDVTGEEILKVSQTEKARILLLTVPDQSFIRLSFERARRLNPTISVIARALSTDDVLELRKLGVGTVIQPEFEGGVAMVREALVQCTGDGAAAARLIQDLRAEFYDAGCKR